MKKICVKIVLGALLALNALEMSAMYYPALRRTGAYRPATGRLYRALPEPEAHEVDRTTVFTEVPNEPVVVESARPSFWQRWFGGSSMPTVEPVAVSQSRMVRRPLTELGQAKEELASMRAEQAYRRTLGESTKGTMLKEQQLQVELLKARESNQPINPSDVSRLQNESYKLSYDIEAMKQVAQDSPEFAQEVASDRRLMELRKSIIDTRLQNAGVATTKAVVPVRVVAGGDVVSGQVPTVSQRWQNLKASWLGPIPAAQQTREAYTATRVFRGPKGGLTRTSREDLQRQKKDLEESIKLQEENEKYIKENFPTDYKMKSAEMQADNKLARTQLELVKTQLSNKKPTDKEVSRLEEAAALEAPRLREMQQTAGLVKGRMPADEYKVFLKDLEAREVAQKTRFEEMSKSPKYRPSYE